MTGNGYSEFSIRDWFFLLCAICLWHQGTNGDRTNIKIYQPIPGAAPCFKRLNGTHQVGCSSSLSGNVGVIHLVENEESLNWVIKDGPHSPYVAVVYPYYLNAEVIVKFKNSGRVSGALVLNSTKVLKVSELSTDLSCPNQGYGLYNSSFCPKWNTPGTGLMYETFDFPIFYVDKEQYSDSIIECFENFNKPVNGTAMDWPLCSAQLTSFMLAAVDTPTCIRRSNQFSLTQTSSKVCDPLGDFNLWTPLLPSNQSEPYSDNPNGSVIVIAARFDGSSMFDGVVPAADSAATGIVTLLTVLKQLSLLKEKLLKQINSSEVKNIYFILFHGEAFGYIGSSRIVYDMKNGNFPAGIGVNDTDVPARLSLSDIKYFIEIGQVAINSQTGSYFIHQANPSLTQNLTSALINEGSSISMNFSSVVTSEEIGFPPSSLQSFLRERPTMPGIVISNHQKEFKNKFYNSIFDDAAQLQYKYGDNSPSSIQTKLADLSSTISNTILKLIQPSTTDKVDVDVKLVDELLHCYIETGNCTLFQTVAGHDKLPATPFDLYVGVHQHYKPLTLLTRVLMMYFQGTKQPNITDEKTCKSSKKTVDYNWINGTCFETSVNVSDAQSPAFIIDNYDWKSGKYSTWTESVWQKFTVRVFLKPSRLHEILTLVFGIAVFVVSFGVVGWVSSKADIIFPSRPAGMAC